MRELFPLLRRRDALRLLTGSALAFAATGCWPPRTSAPPGPPTPPTAPTRAPAALPVATWDGLTAAARAESTLSIATTRDTGYRKVLSDFEVTFPGIGVEQVPFESTAEFVARLYRERQAGQYLWDIALLPGDEMLTLARTGGALDPLWPLLIRPDVLDDSAWRGGFQAGWLDRDAQYVYGITRTRSQSLWIDPAQVPDGSVTRHTDLLDPRWKGRILLGDPRTRGASVAMFTALRLTTRDESVIRRLVKDQEPVIKSDARALTEDTARGRYPIGLSSVTRSYLEDHKKQGVGRTLRHVPLPELDWVTSGNNVLHVINGTPHPGCAALFANWALTREGGTSFAGNLGENSRRSDVRVADDDTLPEGGVHYVMLDAEGVFEEHARTRDVVVAQLA